MIMGPETATLNHAARARQQRIQIAINGLGVLPTTMRIPMRILQLQRSRSAGLKDYADALAMDPSLASKVLSLANSAWFAPPKPVTKLFEAVRTIGLNNLLPLLFSFSLTGIFSKLDLPSSDRESLWATALLKGCAAAEWMCKQKSREATELSEEGFLCGMLQDLALPIIYSTDRAAAMELTVVLDLPVDDRPLREKALFGADHAAFSAMLARKMELPELYIHACATHHDIAGPSLPAQFKLLEPPLRLAAVLPHCSSGVDPLAAERIRSCFAAILQSHPDSNLNFDFNDFIRACFARYQRMRSMLGSGNEENTSFRDFLREVCDQVGQSLTTAIGDANVMINDLRDARDQMHKEMEALREHAAKSDFDPLTNVFNRGGFIKMGQQSLSLAQRYEAECGIGFVDLDDFKRINDTFGHAVGDQALVQIAAALKTQLGSDAVVGRLGGDEFVFVAVAKRQGDQTSSEIVGKLDRIWEHVTMRAPDGSDIQLSGSIGLYWLGVPADQLQIDQAINRADELMYSVKKSGKRRCALGHAAARRMARDESASISDKPHVR